LTKSRKTICVQKELKNRTSSFKEEQGSKKVYLYIQASLVPLHGFWEWDMASEAVFCSDVMFSFPAHFIGTKAIIHPDDISLLEEALEALDDIHTINLEFRIITTYGQVKKLTGKRISIEQDEETQYLLEKTGQAHKQTEKEKAREEAVEIANIQKLIYSEAEKLTQTGIYYFNTVTNKAYYSDQVYMLYGFAPQTLNAHFHTFLPYIHPADREIVTEALDKAYHEGHTLHLDYRIIKVNGDERWIRHILQRAFNEKGEVIIKGVLQDITAQIQLEASQLHAQEEAQFLRQQMHFAEQAGNLGYWQVNLITRKATYSSNYFRIFGLKSNLIPGGLHQFIQYIHPDDSELYTRHIRQLLREHIAPDIEYRIVRADGKIRYIRQSGKLTTNYEEELTIGGIIQDITQEKRLEEKIAQLQERSDIQQRVQELSSTIATLYTWKWDLQTDEMQWSDNFYPLLGLKQKGVEGTYHLFLRQLHPEDKKPFTDTVNHIIEEKTLQQLSLRLFSNGELVYLQASFTVLQLGEKNILITTFQNVTKEQHLKEALSQRINLNEQITENTVDRVAITDIDNNIILWNKACEKAYNVKRQDVLNKNFFDVFPALKNEETLSLFRRTIAGENIHEPFSKAELKNEYQDLHMVPLKDKSGNVTGILHIIKDVTTEFELQQRLTERINFIEQLVENSVDRIIVTDRNMNYQVWNKKAEEYYGLSKEQVVGNNVLEVFPSIMNAPTYNEFKRALKGETVYIPAIEGINEEWHHELYLIPIRDERHEVASVLWILHDLSKDFALRKQEKKASALLDTIQELYFELDHNGHFIYANQRALEVWQKTKEELFGKNAWELFPETLETEGYNIINKALHEKLVTAGDYFSVVLKSWVHMSATPSADGVIVLFYNIDEVRQAQEKLESSEALLRRAELIAQTGSYEVTLPDMTFHFSEGMYRLFGYEPYSITLDIAFIDAVSHPDDAKVIQLILEEAIATKNNYAYERRIQRKDGEWRTMYTRGLVVCDENGKVTKLLGTVQDITEQKQAAETIQKNQEFLLQITHTIPDLINTFNTEDNSITYINDSKPLLGYTTQELLDMGYEKRLRTIIHPDDQELLASFTQSLQLGAADDICSLEYRIVSKQGEVKWVCNRTRLLSGQEAGQPRKLLTAIQDITEQKKAVEEMQESKLFTEQIIEATPDFIMVFDFKVNRISYVNKNAYNGDDERYYETFRISYEQILGRAHPEDREALHQFIQGFKALPDQEIRTHYFRELRGDKVLWFQSRGKVFKRDEQGNVTHYISIVRDVTQEKELDSELEEESRFAEVVMESSVNAIIVLDEELCIKTWNRKAEDMYNVSKQQALNHKLFDLFPKAAEDASIINCIKRALQGESMHLPAKLSVYTNRICEFFYVPLHNEQGHVYGVLNVIHDVTRSEEYASALEEMNLILHQKNLELEQRSEEIATFAFVASHDLKEPLRKMHTFSDWLLEKEAAHLTVRGKDFLGRLNRSVHRLNRLIDDILVLTKIHTDTQNQSDVNLNEIIKAVEEDLSELIHTTNASILSEPLPTITSNKNQLFYLFKNLIHNAIKFQRPGVAPLIEISANVKRNINDPLAQPKTEYLEIAVQDNGIGFDEKYVRKIFKIFQQLHGRGAYDGTGMGLAICRKIMENNKGFITAESKPGMGSVFYCYFPLY
jgi:PAS domain S-box-containing protein